MDRQVYGTMIVHPAGLIKLQGSGTMMKKIIPLLLVFALLALGLPYLVLWAGQSPLPPQPDAGAQSGPQSTDTEDPLLILNSSTGQVETVPMRDFLIGAVASELPISYQKETFKAQAVAAHSYALAAKAAQLAAPTASLKGAYLQADPGNRQGYMTQNAMKAVWQEDYEKNYAWVSAAVDEVLHQVLLYEGQPALATYYAMSNGKSEASENVWSTALPYLVTVELPQDVNAPDYQVTCELSAQEMADALEMHFTALVLTDAPQHWFGSPTRTAAGYVATIPCGGQLLKGTDVRAALSLRSADFTIVCNGDNRFQVTTRGYGHGVGMSQYSANMMAVGGKDYGDILAYFYPGTTLDSVA